MNYISTRDSSGDSSELSYCDVLLQGLAPDRGLYVPIAYPRLSDSDFHRLANLPYPALFREVKGLFIGDAIDVKTQTNLAQQAYTKDKFPGVINDNYCPVTEIVDGLYVQQLSLGPTAAFKDMALQPLGQDMQYVLSQRGESLTLLGATSGDTGSAAEAAVKGLANITLFMLSPEVGMSSFQKAQMGNLSGGNIFNISIPGRFDDCQDIVKAIKQDPEFAHLGAVNSINWGRIASQIPYYVSGYLQVAADHIGQPVDFVVPTGNFGNVLAGYYARKLGVPIRRLIVATNENDVLHTLIQTGMYQKPDHAVVTSSPSMDITVASNYERLVYDLFNGDTEKVRQYMEQFERTGSVAFADFGLSNDTLKAMDFDSTRSTSSDRIDAIRWVHAQSGTVIDPHTADGVTAARQKQEKDVPIICMSTALPVKFETTIKEALGFVPEREPRFADIETLSAGGFNTIPNNPEDVKAFIRQHLG